QAEDGIRDKLVTGVQTCALPICAAAQDQDSSQPQQNAQQAPDPQSDQRRVISRDPITQDNSNADRQDRDQQDRQYQDQQNQTPQIGRASCRERVKISVDSKRLKK